MNIKVLKKQNGMTIQDLVIAIIILCLFVGVIGTLFSQIIINSGLIKLNAIAVEYAVKIAEEVDKLPYDDINENFEIIMNTKYADNFSDIYKLDVIVENYNEIDPSKADIIKIVTIKIAYEIFEEERSYEIKKLKIKEI